LKKNKKLSYRKQIAHKQHTHTATVMNLLGQVFTGKKAYGTSMVAVAVGSINLSVESIQFTGCIVFFSRQAWLWPLSKQASSL